MDDKRWGLNGDLCVLVNYFDGYCFVSGFSQSFSNNCKGSSFWETM